jgi:hypothetical protein
MQVAMAMLCKEIDLCAISMGIYASSCHSAGVGSRRSCVRSATKKIVEEKLDWCMGVANTVHGRVESVLNRLESPRVNIHHMLSVNELISKLGINLSAIGVGIEELIVCANSSNTKLLPRPQTTKCPSKKESPVKKPNITHPRKKLKYAADCCFITLEQLPKCMLVDGVVACDNASVALATTNGHTVCMAHYCGCSSSSSRVNGTTSSHKTEPGAYAFFDPSPGELTVDLSEEEMLEMLRRALNIPHLSAVEDGRNPLRCSDMEEHCSVPPLQGYTVRKFSECSSVKMKHLERKGHGSTNAEGNMPISPDGFYCDVTIFHMQ